MAQHPDVQRRLHTELDTMPLEADGLPAQPSALDSLPWLDAVIKEAMRLHPPANVLIRGLDANLALRTSPDETGYDGRDYLLPAGAWVWIDLIGLHKDPRYWSDPHSFDPSRFLGTAGAGGGEGYLPFGGGVLIATV